ncbi:hypothetical protein [Actinomadura violacea]|uniref:Uncharacterized protein n=1 Tax=Actinomadura violacea TaxID=2819934 RepID=A0ABS3S2B3_9ACTN|nr:hypothetical protein [Actinomadura violacea]MBO2462873.1 hypothetical protein [Actinomadura violacea]
MRRHGWRLVFVGWLAVAMGGVLAIASLCYLNPPGILAGVGAAGGGFVLVRAARQEGLRAAGFVLAGLLIAVVAGLAAGRLPSSG